MTRIFLAIILALLCSGAMAFDIFALGTSNTNCKGVEQSKIFPARLEELLRADGIDVRVINAGVDGDKPVWMEKRLRAGITENTRLVIFEPGANERGKSSNLEYVERILATLQTMKMSTIYVSHSLIQSNEEAEETARKFGAYYYGHFAKGVPTDRVHGQFDRGAAGGHLTAEGCQICAKNMHPIVKQVIGEKQIR